MDEVRLAVEKEYKVLEIFEVYEYVRPQFHLGGADREERQYQD
jgi:hypothetical protein